MPRLLTSGPVVRLDDSVRGAGVARSIPRRGGRVNGIHVGSTNYDTEEDQEERQPRWNQTPGSWRPASIQAYRFQTSLFYGEIGWANQRRDSVPSAAPKAAGPPK